MRISLVFLLFKLICDNCHAEDFNDTLIGVIDLHQYMGAKHGYRKPEVHLRKKRSTIAFSPNQQQALLDKHNELRSIVSPEASNMNFLVWDEDLATLAQEYSEVCKWEHGFPDSDTVSKFDSYGQNLWLSTGIASNQPDGVGAIQAWYNEERWYTYDTRACSGTMCGHYTQVVWGESYALGCGIAFCEPVYGKTTNAWIMTCHYGPAGNYPRHPYLSGPSCTKCTSGSGQCYNNLCRPCEDHNEECICKQRCYNCGTLNSTSCRCTCQQGFINDDCSGICEDTSSYCMAGWWPAQCDLEFVKAGCQRMCGICIPAPDDFECVTTEEPPTTTAVSTTELLLITTEYDTTLEPTEKAYVTDIEIKRCEKVCQNNGTIEMKSCDCLCPSGYQGNYCEENQEQVQNGVQINIEASISIWSDILSDLLDAIEVAVDDHCNNDTNYRNCCPYSGDLLFENETFNYIEIEDIHIADGFPRILTEDSFETMVYVIPEPDNELCEAGSSTTDRKRRYLDRVVHGGRKKRFVAFYLDQEVLYTAIAVSTRDISIAIGVPLGEVKKGVLIVTETPDNDDHGLSRGGKLAVIIVIAVILCMAITRLVLTGRRAR